LWREFFYLVAYKTSNFDRIEGNSICRQIAWNDDSELLAAWTEGRTGYPWIDAVMGQLREEGWIHHLARHAVACFLTRGDLWQSWVAGAKVFDHLLLDADWSLNNANWMWLSCSAFFHQYFRVYSPITFPKKYPNHVAYIKRFVPALQQFPDEYILQPWKAPLSEQKKAQCVIGLNYPHPIVDHDTAKTKNISLMKIAFTKPSSGGKSEEDSDNEQPKRKQKKIKTNK
jgi:cryptochrome